MINSTRADRSRMCIDQCIPIQCVFVFIDSDTRSIRMFVFHILRTFFVFLDFCFVLVHIRIHFYFFHFLQSSNNFYRFNLNFNKNKNRLPYMATTRVSCVRVWVLCLPSGINFDVTRTYIHNNNPHIQSKQKIQNIHSAIDMH